MKDLASSAGSLAGGDKKVALHTIQGIGLNYKREMRENPVGFTMNAASVVLPIGGLALKAAVDMDRLAVAYDAINDSKMAARARAWRDLYRERSAIGEGSSARKNMFENGNQEANPLNRWRDRRGQVRFRLEVSRVLGV